MRRTIVYDAPDVNSALAGPKRLKTVEKVRNYQADIGRRRRLS
jgi:hypothetical protein